MSQLTFEIEDDYKVKAVLKVNLRGNEKTFDKLLDLHKKQYPQLDIGRFKLFLRSRHEVGLVTVTYL